MAVDIYIQRHTVKERDELRGGESVVFTESGELVVVVLLREVSVCERERERGRGRGRGKMVVGESESARRRLRSAYRSLHEAGVKERDAITQGGDNARLLMHMNQVEELGTRAVKTTEMAIDAAMVLQCAEFAHKMVERHNPDKAIEPRYRMMSSRYHKLSSPE